MEILLYPSPKELTRILTFHHASELRVDQSYLCTHQLYLYSSISEARSPSKKDPRNAWNKGFQQTTHNTPFHKLDTSDNCDKAPANLLRSIWQQIRSGERVIERNTIWFVVEKKKSTFNCIDNRQSLENNMDQRKLVKCK